MNGRPTRRFVQTLSCRALQTPNLRIPVPGGVVIFTTQQGPAPRHARTAVATLVAALALLAGAPAAHAADLLLLDGEQASISGDVSYGFVYVDGELRLTGDTSITAGSIYFGPNSGLRTCYVEGTGNGGCTAGRSLTLRSTGQLTVSSNIDLTAGTGTVRPAGALVVQGGQVAIGGDVNTSGSGGGTSGGVSITSAGTLSVGAVTAFGAPVSLGAVGAIDVGGDIQTQGTANNAAPDPARMQIAGEVAINSSAGDARVNGNINASGRDAPANAGAGLLGGLGAAVSISGSDVRTGGIDTTGGSSADADAGPSKSISLSARGALHVLGRLDAGGQNSTSAGASGGSTIGASAGGPLVVAGGAYAGGAQGLTGGSPGGQITLKGQSVDTGSLFAAGGNAPTAPAPGNGGAGGSIAVTAAGNAAVGSVQTYGGNAPAGTSPGAGGPISIASTAGSISTGRLNSHGGYPNGGPGAAGGGIALSAQSDLAVGGSLDSSGSNASGDAAPPRPGGSAGSVLLRAAGGTLSLGDNVYATGGSGAAHPTAGNPGGAGGNGGRIDVVAQKLGSIVAISTHGGSGGDYGDDQGPGGSGGAVFGWTDAPLFDDQKVVDTDGGSGHPVGSSGLKTQESSPSALAIDPVTGLLSFTSRSPDAQSYRVLRSVGGAPPTVVLDSAKTSGLAAPATVCVPVTFTVVAVSNAVGWTSDAPAAIPYVRQPSATQRCADAPKLTAKKKLKFSLRKLRRSKWKLALALRSSGIGSVQASLVRQPRKGTKTSKKVLGKLDAKLSRAGNQTLRLALTKAARHQGRYALRVVTIAPDGKGRAKQTLTLEVTR